MRVLPCSYGIALEVPSAVKLDLVLDHDGYLPCFGKYSGWLLLRTTSMCANIGRVIATKVASGFPSVRRMRLNAHHL